MDRPRARRAAGTRAAAALRDLRGVAARVSRARLRRRALGPVRRPLDRTARLLARVDRARSGALVRRGRRLLVRRMEPDVRVPRGAALAERGVAGLLRGARL